MKKILTIIIVILIIAIGVYFGFSKKPSLTADIGGIEIPEIKIPFESGLGELELSNFDIDISLPANLFSNIFVDTDWSSGTVELQKPGVLVEPPSIKNEAPPAGWEPDEATCAQFKAAPSCSFVPAQYRDLCEKCKAKGY